jgi:hypothetical protein
LSTLNAVEPLLVPVVTGVVGAIGVALKDARLDRDKRSLRDEALGDARDEVAFVSEWWKAHQLIGTAESSEATHKALAWLAEAEAKVLNTSDLKATPKREVTLRRLLLLEPMHRRGAKILRALYLIDVVWVVLASVVTASDTASKSGHGWVVSDIGVLVFFAVLGLILRALAVSADKPQEPQIAPGGGRRPIVAPGLNGADAALAAAAEPLAASAGDAVKVTG